MIWRLLQRLSLALSIAVVLSGESEAADGDPQTPASPSHTPSWQAEAFYFYQHTSDTVQQQRLTLRSYQPFRLADGWQLTFREDFRGLYTNARGPDNPDGVWRAHLGDMFVQPSLKTPPVAPGLAIDLGMRLVFPTGDLPPYSPGRFRIGPHVGLIWDLPRPLGMVTLAPLVSYLTTVGEQRDGGVDISAFQFHPIVLLKPASGLSVAFWREHPLILNTLTNRWFVPFDALASYEVIPHLSLGLGVTLSLQSNDRLYDNIFYGRVAFSF